MFKSAINAMSSKLSVTNSSKMDIDEICLLGIGIEDAAKIDEIILEKLKEIRDILEIAAKGRPYIKVGIRSADTLIRCEFFDGINTKPPLPTPPSGGGSGRK